MVAIGMLGLNACGGSDFEGKCNDSCAAEAKCSNPGETEADCKAGCTDLVALNKAAGCDSQADDVAGCVDTSNACSTTTTTPSTACQTKETAYGTCIETYCSGTGKADTNCSAFASEG